MATSLAIRGAAACRGFSTAMGARCPPKDFALTEKREQAPALQISGAEIPVHPRPAQRQRLNPLVCADRRAWLARLAGCRVVSRASRPWLARPGHQEKLVRRGPAPPLAQRSNPRRAAKPHA